MKKDIVDKKEGNVVTPSSRMPKEEMNEAVSVNLLELGIHFGLIIFIPLFVCIGIGFYVDKTYQTTPFFIIIGVFLALGISSYALYKKIVPILHDLEKSTKK